MSIGSNYLIYAVILIAVIGGIYFYSKYSTSLNEIKTESKVTSQTGCPFETQLKEIIVYYARQDAIGYPSRWKNGGEAFIQIPLESIESIYREPYFAVDASKKELVKDYKFGFASKNFASSDYSCTPESQFITKYIYTCRKGSGVGENINYVYCSAHDENLGYLLISKSKDIISSEGIIKEKIRERYIITSLIVDKMNFQIIDLKCNNIICMN